MSRLAYLWPVGAKHMSPMLLCDELVNSLRALEGIEISDPVREVIHLLCEKASVQREKRLCLRLQLNKAEDALDASRSSMMAEKRRADAAEEKVSRLQGILHRSRVLMEEADGKRDLVEALRGHVEATENDLRRSLDRLMEELEKVK
jgi:hypothetical protein